MWKRKGLIIAGVLGLLLVAAVTLGVWAYGRDPLASLPPPEHGLQAERTTFPAQEHRQVERIRLPGNTLGEIAFTLSLPHPLPPEKLPVVMVLGGPVTSEDSIRYIKNAGDNAIVGYAWPMPVRLHGVRDFMDKAPGFYHQVMTIPGQVVSALHWLREQPWADGDRISLLGFSLGALAAPSVQDVAAHDGIRIGWTIIAYGGAPLGAVIVGHPNMKPVWLRDALAPLVDLAFHPLEPTAHLPRLSGKFLVLEGREDNLIPAAARQVLREAVPEPKTVITFEGIHMGVGRGKMTLLQKIINTSKTWLMENGAVNHVP